MNNRSIEIYKPFEDHRELMEDRIISGIEANRKGLMKLEFKDKDGKALNNVHVELNQKTHDFRFGANIFMLDELETNEKNAEYQKKFKELFNLATIPFYWCDLEPQQGKPRFAKDSPKLYRRPTPDLCVEFCKKNGIEPKLHCLNYDQWTPHWVPNDTQSVKKYMDKRIFEIAERYKDKIPSMEVINETLCAECDRDTSHSTRFFHDADIVEWSFANARKHLPANKLIINEATDFVWGNAFKHNRSAYYMQIERALAKGATIDSIGMQYHMFYRAENEKELTAPHYNPKTMYNVMDQYADFNKPLQVTEITIPAYSTSNIDEELQAKIIENLYKIWFSHANMEAIVYWNVADGYAAFAPLGDMSYGENYFHGGLLRFDMSPKPAYNVLKKLIHETWHTKLSLNSDNNSSICFKGFYGEYEAKITINGVTTEKKLHLEKNADNNITIII